MTGSVLKIMADLPSLLLRSFPPVAFPLTILLAASFGILRVLEGRRRQPPTSSSSTSSAAARPQRSALSIAASLLLFLSCLAAMDEISSRGGLLGLGLGLVGLDRSDPGGDALPPSLPPRDDPRYESVRSTLVEAVRSRRRRRRRERRASTGGSDGGNSNGGDDDDVDGGGGGDDEGGGEGEGEGATALITGASSGIGRSIAFELARRGLVSSFLLVGRGGKPGASEDALSLVASDLREAYGASSVSILRADLSLPGEARRVYLATATAAAAAALDDAAGAPPPPPWKGVDYLILCAGWGPTSDLIDLELDHGSRAWEKVTTLNAESPAVMAGLYGRDMMDSVAAATAETAATEGEGKQRKRKTTPRILLVASITGTFPGMPGASLYAATKSFLLSLGRSLSVEMEPHGVSVTTSLPGATLTDFASKSGMSDAALWNFPFDAVMTSDAVARMSVEGMMKGRVEVVPGIMNTIAAVWTGPLIPSRLAMKFFRFCWSPWPYAFPPGWRRGVSSSSSTKEERGGGEGAVDQSSSCPSGNDGKGGEAERRGTTNTAGSTSSSSSGETSPSQHDPLSSRVLTVENYAPP